MERVAPNTTVAVEFVLELDVVTADEVVEEVGVEELVVVDVVLTADEVVLVVVDDGWARRRYAPTPAIITITITTIATATVDIDL